MLDEAVAEGQVGGAGVDLFEAVDCRAECLGMLRQLGILADVILDRLPVLDDEESLPA
ncbi:MAG: hypothetical protein PUE35_06680 [Bacteroidales bacterium]|nr:hypothetical protein [Bacteroidales bacterium]